MPLTVGTAGHVDHGKTTLVRALTGKDTDRLPEERARGISIELGYAPLELASGRTLSLVDVPGHERFVRTMVAGATGIDLFLLVVDAAEGARPQTHEHLAVLRLLGVEHGVVAVTKTDAVDDETLELALEEGRELVPDAPVVAVSGVTGAGLDDLRAALDEIAADITPRRADFPARLFVDRAFTLRGIGTVVDGDALVGNGRGGRPPPGRARGSGCPRPLRPGARQPGRACRGRPARCRQPSRRRAARPPARRRPGGAGRIPMVVPPRGGARGARADRRRRAAHGASRDGRIAARVVRVGDSHAQLRLAAPVVAARGDRVVLRGETTLGGGVVLDPAPPRRVDAERDRLLGGDDPASIVRALVHAPVSVTALATRALLDGAALEEGLDAVRVVDGWAFSDAWLEETGAAVEARLREQAERSPLDPGVALGELLPSEPWAGKRARPAACRATRAEGVPSRGGCEPRDACRRGGCARGRSLARRVVRDEGRRQTARTVSRVRGPTRPPRRRFAVSSGAYQVARDLVMNEAAAAGEITLARFRDLAGVGRRDAQLLLERMDVDGVTRRVGDRRVLRRTARTGG